MGVLARRAKDAAAAELAASIASYAVGIPQHNIVDDARGSPQTAFARQLAMYLCHVGFELSLARVAAAFGRDRSTVAHACREIEDRREDGQFDLWVSALEGMLHRAPFAAVSNEKVRR